MTLADQAFRGEFELASDTLQDDRLADFHHLPGIEFIGNLAGEFNEEIELMPYQKDGWAMCLLVSVYLKPREYEGRVIAVLNRGEFPSNREGLAELVLSARTRLASLKRLSDRFETESIDFAWDQLTVLLQKITDSL